MRTTSLPRRSARLAVGRALGWLSLAALALFVGQFLLAPGLLATVAAFALVFTVPMAVPFLVVRAVARLEARRRPAAHPAPCPTTSQPSR